MSPVFIDLARSRKTCRTFTEEPLTEEEMGLIMEAGRLAPSSRKLDDVRLVPVRDVSLIRRLALCKPSSTTPLETATIMIQLEAEDLGLGSCWVQVRLRDSDSGTAEEFVIREAGLDPEWKVLSIVAVGRRR